MLSRDKMGDVVSDRNEVKGMAQDEVPSGEDEGRTDLHRIYGKLGHVVPSSLPDMTSTPCAWQQEHVTLTNLYYL